MGTETAAEEMRQIYLLAVGSEKTLNQCTTPVCDCCVQQSFVLNVGRNRLSLWGFFYPILICEDDWTLGCWLVSCLKYLRWRISEHERIPASGALESQSSHF